MVKQCQFIYCYYLLYIIDDTTKFLFALGKKDLLVIFGNVSDTYRYRMINAIRCYNYQLKDTIYFSYKKNMFSKNFSVEH